MVSAPLDGSVHDDAQPFDAGVFTAGAESVPRSKCLPTFQLSRFSSSRIHTPTKVNGLTIAASERRGK